jgi:hypothetical protein
VRLILVFTTGLFSALLACAALFCTVIAVNTARLPFNSEGRYFDGVVVHHDSAILAFGIAALVLWLLTLLFSWLSCKAWRQRGN